LEPEDFVPSAAPIEEHTTVGGNGQGDENKANGEADQNRLKNQKMAEETQGENRADGPVPMQLALTPFPQNVNVSEILQAKKLNAINLDQAVEERKRFRFMYKRRSVSPAARDNSATDCTGDKLEEAATAVSTGTKGGDLTGHDFRSNSTRAEGGGLTDSSRRSDREQPLPASPTLGANIAAQSLVGDKVLIARQMRSEGDRSQATPVNALISPSPKYVFRRSSGDSQEAVGVLPGDPLRTTPNAVAGKSMECQEVHKGKEIGIPAQSTQLTGSPLHCSTRLLNTSSADGISAADEDTLQKSMKRTAWKNLDGVTAQEKAATNCHQR
jgi:hypothetical protein